jgi:hypothetical protein
LLAEENLKQTIHLARTVSGAPLNVLLHHASEEVQGTLLHNPHLTEEHLCILLARKDLARGIVARIACDKERMKSYALKVAVLKHPKTPRHLALPLLKFIRVLELMAIAGTVGVSPEVKRLAEDAILGQRESLDMGQRLTLARRGSTRIAAGMLLDGEGLVIQAALANPLLTEAAVTAALLHERAGAALSEAVTRDARWCGRRSVKLALARSPHLSLARLAGLLAELPMGDLKMLAGDGRLPANLRSYIAQIVQTRARQAHQKKV